jgi:hypothetical protein
MGGRERDRRPTPEAAAAPPESEAKDLLRERAVQQRLRERRSQGTPIAEGVREKVEAATGSDLSAVQAHTDDAAAASSRAVGAKAFAAGSEVHFARGQYQPGTTEGDRLIAHELVHTVQQSKAGPSLQRKTSHSGDASEKEADAIADAALAGRPAPPVQQAAAPIALKEGDEKEPPQQRTVITEFGKFVVVPDDVRPEGDSEIGESELREATMALAQIENGSSSIQIDDHDDQGVAHDGFRDEVIDRFQALLRTATGRALVLSLAADGKGVTIKPSSKTFKGGITSAADDDVAARPGEDGLPGAGSSTSIYIDSDLQDEENWLFDAAGKPFFEPKHVSLGHELIHALDNAKGDNLDALPGSDPDKWGNAEEERTITREGLSEDQLLDDLGKPPRGDHRGHDSRNPNDDTP